MNNILIFQSKNDVPFPEAQVSIHQPTINEISLIGEERLLSAYQIFHISKNKSIEMDKMDSTDKTEFEIFMSMMSDKENSKFKQAVELLLTLLFPGRQIKFTDTDVLLFNDTSVTRLNGLNFPNFLEFIEKEFSFSGDSTDDYNPVDGRAEKIAEKLRKGKEKRQKASSTYEEEGVAILNRYVSILSVGLQKDKNMLMEYTVPQLVDEFKRFQLNYAFEMNLRARLAGATDLEDVDNWMDEIHS